MSQSTLFLVRRYAEQIGDEKLIALIDDAELMQQAADVLRPEMSMKTYQHNVERTMGYSSDGLILGLAGEIGEVIEIWKKHKYHGRALNRLRMIEELGDIFWYLAAFAGSLGIDLDVISRTNIEKLKKRYPNGFSK